MELKVHGIITLLFTSISRDDFNYCFLQPKKINCISYFYSDHVQ